MIQTQKATDARDLPHSCTSGKLSDCEFCGRNADDSIHTMHIERAHSDEPRLVTEKGT